MFKQTDSQLLQGVKGDVGMMGEEGNPGLKGGKGKKGAIVSCISPTNLLV